MGCINAHLGPDHYFEIHVSLRGPAQFPMRIDHNGMWQYISRGIRIQVIFVSHCCVIFRERLAHKDTKQLVKHIRIVSRHEMLANAEIKQHFYLQPPSIFVPLLMLLPRSRYLKKDFWLLKQEHSNDQTCYKQPSRFFWSSITMYSRGYKAITMHTHHLPVK